MGIRARAGRFGSGGFAAAGVLALAAAPTFAAMALWTTIEADPPGMICASNPGWIEGMTVMYALMSIFHLSPWARLHSVRAETLSSRDTVTGHPRELTDPD
jgi:hypothetical protein